MIGNHEDWLLKTTHDYSSHSWLFSMGAPKTIASYSPAAAARIDEEMERLGPALLTDKPELPYHEFFDAMPDAHRRFYEELLVSYEDENGFFCHAGIDPEVPLTDQIRRTLVWGNHTDFAAYRGKPIVYGHWSNALERASEVRPRQVGDTFGIDSIKFGRLMAFELPSGNHVSVE